MSDLEFYVALFSPTIIGLLIIGTICWVWISPSADGSVDGRWGSPRDEEGRYSGLRRVIYDRAYRKNYRESRHRNG